VSSENCYEFQDLGSFRKFHFNIPRALCSTQTALESLPGTVFLQHFTLCCYEFRTPTNICDSFRVLSGWYAEHIALSVPGADRGSFPGIPPQCPALVCSDCVTKTKADPFPLGSLRVNSGRKCSTLSLLCVSLIICCTSVLLTTIRKEVQNVHTDSFVNG